MADDIQFSLVGIDGLLSRLATVNDEVKRRTGRTALRRAAELVANHAREGAVRHDDPETGRSIADNIVLRWNGRLFRRTGSLGFRVGVLHGAVLKRGGSAEANAPTPHWRLLEFGTEQIAADPFMRPALADHVAEVTDEFVTQFEKGLDRALRRAEKARSN
ncbi:HK97-gp10 family putative phage morphogenesis protein [Pseudomonas protegens]|uniref:HK97-gp10 family putative phage morphogenesis protein n=1 Tax=Pseudomonas protegens TaxID=380021 RepID=UPI002160B07F|nr:HK97-gp10 family putative phage morphogenesis protein [Pseudomonas protegens]UVL70602.1 HK97 gp10 family phage protein [Pseudomonas protegens]